VLPPIGVAVLVTERSFDSYTLDHALPFATRGAREERRRELEADEAKAIEKREANCRQSES
jgi:hypothetical protein